MEYLITGENILHHITATYAEYIIDDNVIGTDDLSSLCVR
jgi:hypothetical protein